LSSSSLSLFRRRRFVLFEASFCWGSVLPKQPPAESGLVAGLDRPLRAPLVSSLDRPPQVPRVGLGSLAQVPRDLVRHARSTLFHETDPCRVVDSAHNTNGEHHLSTKAIVFFFFFNLPVHGQDGAVIDKRVDDATLDTLAQGREHTPSEALVLRRW
jgi:hypothetical protein